MESPFQHSRLIAPSVSWEILHLVKRSNGLSVKELMAELKMSYMGVKQHCDDLKRRGYLDTWRRAKQAGRPEKIFRATDKLDVLLPQVGEELALALLGLATQFYGASAPDRLLHQFLQQKAAQWELKVKGRTIAERAQEVVKLRNASGWICEYVTSDGEPHILDHHSPFVEVGRMFPTTWDMEVRLLTRLIGGEVDRIAEGDKTKLILPKEKPKPLPRETLFD
jgi:predicted ArsR family transcriptional regulator